MVWFNYGYEAGVIVGKGKPFKLTVWELSRYIFGKLLLHRLHFKTSIFGKLLFHRRELFRPKHFQPGYFVQPGCISLATLIASDFCSRLGWLYWAARLQASSSCIMVGRVDFTPWRNSLTAAAALQQQAVPSTIFTRKQQKAPKLLIVLLRITSYLHIMMSINYWIRNRE